MHWINRGSCLRGRGRSIYIFNQSRQHSYTIFKESAGCIAGRSGSVGRVLDWGSQLLVQASPTGGHCVVFSKTLYIFNDCRFFVQLCIISVKLRYPFSIRHSPLLKQAASFGTLFQTLLECFVHDSKLWIGCFVHVGLLSMVAKWNGNVLRMVTIIMNKCGMECESTCTQQYDARKPFFRVLQITQAQTSLRIRTVWSARLLFAFWKVPYVNLLQVNFQFSS